MKNKELNESLQRYRELLGYDPKKGGESLNEVRRHSYLADNTDYATDYADEEETEEEETDTEEEGGDNPDFDFGDEGGGDEETGTDEEGDDAGFGEGGEEGGEEEEDEFGTADEFSAADELEDAESDEDVEEIDVTDIVKKSEDAKSYSEKAVKAAEEGKNMITDLMSKFDALQNSLSKIDSVANELNVIKKDIQSQKPKEKLELRSLDSYPFNVKLTDYWNDEKLKDNYEITSGEPDAKSQDGEVKVWKLDPNEAKDFSNVDIKKSFVPESKTKKKVLTEVDENYVVSKQESDFRKTFHTITSSKNLQQLNVAKNLIDNFSKKYPKGDADVMVLNSKFNDMYEKLQVDTFYTFRDKSFIPESKTKKKVLTEAALWDKIRDKWYELTTIAKGMGYALKNLPSLYSLKKKGNQEGYDKLLADIHAYAEKLIKEHPRHELRSSLQNIMYDLEKLDDLTYKEFDRDPSKFSPQQQDILMKGMKVTDKGVERDRDIYNLKK